MGDIVQSSSTLLTGKRSHKPRSIFDPSDSHVSKKQSKNKSVSTSRKTKSSPQTQVHNHQPTHSKGPSGPSKTVIQSKLQATERSQKFQLVKTGGGSLCDFNAGSYELFKRVLSQAFYSADGLILEGRQLQCQSSSPPQDTPHQYTSTIRVASQDVTTKEVAAYTINFYHSKCRILVNGKNESQFSHDLKLVIQNISRKQEYGSLPTDEQLNDAVRQILEADLQPAEQTSTPEPPSSDASQSDTASVSTGTPVSSKVSANDVNAITAPGQNQPQVIHVAQGVPSPTTPFQSLIPPVDDITNRLGSVSLDSSSPALNAVCKSCNRPAKSKCITCHVCNKAVHFNCEKIRDITTQQELLNKGRYTCKACTQIAPPVLNITNSAHVNTASTIASTGADDQLEQQSEQQTDEPTPIITFPDDEDDSGTADSPSSGNQATPAQQEQIGGPQTPNTGQNINNDVDERIKRCQSIEQDVRKREKALQSREDKLKIREHNMQNKQEDLAKAQAYIVQLEAKVKDLENSLRIARMSQPPPPAPSSSTTPTPGSPTILDYTKMMCQLSEQKMKTEMAELKLEISRRNPPMPPVPPMYPPFYPQPPVNVIHFPVMYPTAQQFQPQHQKRRGPPKARAQEHSTTTPAPNPRGNTPPATSHPTTQPANAPTVPIVTTGVTPAHTPKPGNTSTVPKMTTDVPLANPPNPGNAPIVSNPSPGVPLANNPIPGNAPTVPVVTTGVPLVNTPSPVAATTRATSLLGSPPRAVNHPPQTTTDASREVLQFNSPPVPIPQATTQPAVSTDFLTHPGLSNHPGWVQARGTPSQ